MARIVAGGAPSGFLPFASLPVAKSRVIVSPRFSSLEVADWPSVRCGGSARGQAALAGPEGRAGAGPDVLALRADARRQAGRQVQRAARPQRPAVAGRPAPGVAGAGRCSGCANSSAAAARTTSSGGPRAASTAAFLERHGVWRGPYEEGTLFFYLDEYAKDQPKDLLSVLTVTGDWLTHALKKQSTLVEKNIDALAGLLQLNKAERACCCTARSRATSATCAAAGRVQGQQRARGLRRHRRHRRRERGRGGRGAARGLAAGTHRPGREPDLRAQHHRPGRPDEGQREAAAGADARVPRPERADGRVHAALGQERAHAARLLLRAGRRAGAARPAARAVARKEPGVNVLLYGPPGTGKTELAKVVAQAAGWSSVRGRVRRPRRQLAERAATATARCRSRRCSSRAARRPLLFDEVEDVFPPISSDRGGADDGARRAGFRGPPAAASAARPGSTRSSNRTRCPRCGSPTASSRSTRPSGAASPTTWS
jgi:hypothetical protein